MTIIYTIYIRSKHYSNIINQSRRRHVAPIPLRTQNSYRLCFSLVISYSLTRLLTFFGATVLLTQ